MGRDAMLRIAFVLAFFVPGARAQADEAGDARVQIRTALGQMDGTAHRIRLLLGEARAKKSSTVVCLDESLSRADVAFRRGKEHARIADDAFGHGDLQTGRFELGIVRSMRESSREASKMADTCAAGKLDFPTPGVTTVKVVITK